MGYRVSVPGRSEIAGNHTDHQGGPVIAAGVDRRIMCEATLLDKPVIEVESTMCDSFTLALDDSAFCEPRQNERETTVALVRGMAAQLKKASIDLAGCRLCFDSTIPQGAGLSSSAAFEICTGVALMASAFRPQGFTWETKDFPLSPIDIALMAQVAESKYFGKPCGAMDQMACALGGMHCFDFKESGHPKVEAIELPDQWDSYVMYLIDCGCSHEGATAEYAQVAIDMADVARYLSVDRLCDMSAKDYVARLGEVRSALGDRAALRALHFYNECDLVGRRIDCLKCNEMSKFVGYTAQSGISSAEYLQNVCLSGAHQPAMVTLALTRLIIDSLDDGQSDYLPGAARIHGGGFGGAIQVFVYAPYKETFEQRLAPLVGKEAMWNMKVGGSGIEVSAL